MQIELNDTERALLTSAVALNIMHLQALMEKLQPLPAPGAADQEEVPPA